MQRAIFVHPIRPDAADDHRSWCQELRRRRYEFGASRAAVGITRHVSWVQPGQGLAVVRVDAADPVAALARLARSDSPFDRWYRDRELAIHPFALGDAPTPPEVLVDHATDPVDPFDLFIAVALPVLPGRTEAYRRTIADRAREGQARDRMRRWGVRRMAMWLQTLPGVLHGGRDVVVYELAGDVPRMITALTTDPAPEMAGQRALLLDAFGLDTGLVGFPMPLPAFSWSSDGAVDDPPAIGT